MKTTKQYCFFCGRGYYPDDPEFDSERKLCDHCVEQLDQDNPFVNQIPEKE